MAHKVLWGLSDPRYGRRELNGQGHLRLQRQIDLDKVCHCHLQPCHPSRLLSFPKPQFLLQEMRRLVPSSQGCHEESEDVYKVLSTEPAKEQMLNKYWLLLLCLVFSNDVTDIPPLC